MHSLYRRLFAALLTLVLLSAGSALAEPSVDLNLTAMSSTMVYAEVYNIVMEPMSCVGKTVRMRGMYNTSYSPELNTHYHFVVIADATACCAQGLEFVWKGEHAVPVDYPAVNSEIELVGTYDSDLEEGATYCALFVDEINVISPAEDM